MKKYFIITLFALFFMMFEGSQIKAEGIGTCIISQLDKTYEVEVPFYWYNVNMTTKISGSLTHTISYSHNETYIDSKEQCLHINGEKPGIIDEIGQNSTFIINTYNFSATPLTNSEYIYNTSIFESEDYTFQKDLTIYSEYISLDNLPPVMVTDNLNPIIVVQVEHTINANFLKEKITAYDEVDGIIDVKIHENNYSGNQSKLGEYTIVFSATDTSNNTAYITITIKVVDTTKPTITGKTALKSFMSNPLTIKAIKDSLIIQDNYYQISTKDLHVLEDNYSSSLNKEGFYTITFNVTDSSNNTSEPFTITIEIFDDIIPVIQGEIAYEVSNKLLLNLDDIKNQLIVKDNIDANPTIEITNDLYTNNYYIVGIYQVTYIAKDKNGNTSIPHTVNITVKDITKPTFYISQKFIGIDGSSNITLDQLIDIIEETNNITNENLINRTIIKDEYTLNRNVPGTYVIELNYEYENKENINIETHIIVDNYNKIEDSQEKNTPKKDFWSVIKNILLKIWNFIKYIFSFKWLKI